MTNFRTIVFKAAYQINKACGLAFSECLRKAWALYRLTKKMLNGVAEFSYQKTDGTIRKAKGTLQDIEQHIKGTGKSSPNTCVYWDVEAAGFRSFKLENLIA